jgi:hypothetical protein
MSPVLVRTCHFHARRRLVKITSKIGNLSDICQQDLSGFRRRLLTRISPTPDQCSQHNRACKRSPSGSGRLQETSKRLRGRSGGGNVWDWNSRMYRKSLLHIPFACRPTFAEQLEAAIYGAPGQVCLTQIGEMAMIFQRQADGPACRAVSKAGTIGSRIAALPGRLADRVNIRRRSRSRAAGARSTTRPRRIAGCSRSSSRRL